jgi:HEPN/Toprim N-terminal domain 1
MGSVITLGLNNIAFELNWGKLLSQQNFSQLFQRTDLQTVDFLFLVDEGERFVITPSQGVGFKKSLSNIKDRLDLLGYRLDTLKDRFNEIAVFFEESPCDFDVFRDLLTNVRLPNYDPSQEYADFDPGEYFYRLTCPGIFRPA